MIENSENFATWFGASQVLNSQGKPLVVYHGTGSDFTRFGTGRGAIYFTCDPEIASIYANEADGYDAQGDDVDSAPSVIPVFLSMKNPLVLDEVWAVEGLDYDGDRDWTAFDETIYQASKRGHDGVILRGVVDFSGMNEAGERTVRPYDQYIVFDAKQVKSAIGNSGAFDPNDADFTDRRGMNALKALEWLETITPQKGSAPYVKIPTLP